MPFRQARDQFLPTCALLTYMYAKQSIYAFHLTVRWCASCLDFRRVGQWFLPAPAMAAAPRPWLPLLLLLLVSRPRLAAAVTGCDGLATQIDECNLPEDDNTLSHCECNYCQTYGTTLVAYGGNPPGGTFESDFSGVTLSWIVPGIQSNHTLCLLHWAFIKVPTTHVNAQGVVEGQGVVVSIDTEYDSGENRFTSVDVLEITSGSLPEAYSTVHSENYPYDVFGLAQAYADGPWEGNRGGHKLFFKQDAYMYSSGYDPEGEQCRGGQPEFLYFGVRCGNNDEGITEAWNVPDEPCRFNVNVHLLPYELEAGDLLDDVPIQQGTTHYYGMAVGEYDVLRVSFERLGNNLTATDADGNVVATSGHGLIGNLLFDVDSCPTWGQHMEYHALTNMSKAVVREGLTPPVRWCAPSFSQWCAPSPCRCASGSARRPARAAATRSRSRRRRSSTRRAARRGTSTPTAASPRATRRGSTSTRAGATTGCAPRAAATGSRSSTSPSRRGRSAWARCARAASTTASGATSRW